ncbi:hypothetical protein IWZ00DRAFT_142303 [Phyllosticta capitalensis]
MTVTVPDGQRRVRVRVRCGASGPRICTRSRKRSPDRSTMPSHMPLLLHTLTICAVVLRSPRGMLVQDCLLTSRGRRWEATGHAEDAFMRHVELNRQLPWRTDQDTAGLGLTWSGLVPSPYSVASYRRTAVATDSFACPPDPGGEYDIRQQFAGRGQGE